MPITVITLLPHYFATACLFQCLLPLLPYYLLLCLCSVLIFNAYYRVITLLPYCFAPVCMFIFNAHHRYYCITLYCFASVCLFLNISDGPMFITLLRVITIFFKVAVLNYRHHLSQCVHSLSIYEFIKTKYYGTYMYYSLH
jgi:hypothetical protein